MAYVNKCAELMAASEKTFRTLQFSAAKRSSLCDHYCRSIYFYSYESIYESLERPTLFEIWDVTERSRNMMPLSDPPQLKIPQLKQSIHHEMGKKKVSFLMFLAVFRYVERKIQARRPIVQAWSETPNLLLGVFDFLRPETKEVLIKFVVFFLCVFEVFLCRF